MPTDNVKITAKCTGRRDGLPSCLAETIESELFKMTGLKPADVSFSAASDTFEVTLRGLEGGQPSDKTYVGRSTEGIDAAIRDAMKGGVVDYDSTQIAVSLERTAEAPYFTVPVRVRSFKRDRLAGYHTDAVGQLANTYGRRLRQEAPDSVEHAVYLLKDSFGGDDGQIPKGEFEKVVVQGRSQVSMDDAYSKTRGFRLTKARGTVYEQTALMLVYGQEEKSAARATEAGAPAVHTARKSGAAAAASSAACARAASPAGREPAQLTSVNALM